MLIQAIEREFLSGRVLQNYGIPEGYNIHCLLSQLGHILRISDGMVYPLHNKTPPYRPIIQNEVADNKTSNIYGSQAHRFIPAGSEGGIDVSNHSCTLDVVNEFSAERNEDDVAEACHQQAKVTEIVENSFVSTTRSLTLNTAEGVYKKKLFYVLLTVHLGSVLINNQLDAQFFFCVYLFQFCTCFEHPCAHHQENQLSSVHT